MSIESFRWGVFIVGWLVMTPVGILISTVVQTRLFVRYRTFFLSKFGIREVYWRARSRAERGWLVAGLILSLGAVWSSLILIYLAPPPA